MLALTLPPRSRLVIVHPARRGRLILWAVREAPSHAPGPGPGPDPAHPRPRDGRSLLALRGYGFTLGGRTLDRAEFVPAEHGAAYEVGVVGSDDSLRVGVQFTRSGRVSLAFQEWTSGRDCAATGHAFTIRREAWAGTPLGEKARVG